VHNLVDDPYPKQCLGLTAPIADALVEFHRPLEEVELARVLLALGEEACVRDASASEGKVGLHLIQLAVGGGQGVDITAEDRALVQLLRPVDPAVLVHVRNPVKLADVTEAPGQTASPTFQSLMILGFAALVCSVSGGGFSVVRVTFGEWR
jgi:hypothetical protein